MHHIAYVIMYSTGTSTLLLHTGIGEKIEPTTVGVAAEALILTATGDIIGEGQVLVGILAGSRQVICSKIVSTIYFRHRTELKI